MEWEFYFDKFWNLSKNLLKILLSDLDYYFVLMERYILDFGMISRLRIIIYNTKKLKNIGNMIKKMDLELKNSQEIYRLNKDIESK